MLSVAVGDEFGTELFAERQVLDIITVVDEKRVDAILVVDGELVNRGCRRSLWKPPQTKLALAVNINEDQTECNIWIKILRFCSEIRKEH